MKYKEEILNYVRNHPGCTRNDISEAIGDPIAEDETDDMVKDGRLERWYIGLTPHYHITGTYVPPHMKEPSTDQVIPKIDKSNVKIFTYRSRKIRQIISVTGLEDNEDWELIDVRPYPIGRDKND